MRLALALSFFFILGCSSSECLNTKVAKKESSHLAEPSALERVHVFKPDGSLQCGQGSLRALEQDQLLLKSIKVYSAVNKNDGQMRIQLCGSPTGNSNVFEISKSDLDKALKLGFKHWIFE